MRDDIKRRLQRVTKKLALVHRLRKVALATEEALIDRMAERSKKVLLDLRGKFVRALKQVETTLEPAAREALKAVVDEVFKVVSNSGEVNQAAIEEAKSNLENTWKQISKTSRGSMPAMYLFNAGDRFVTVAMLASLLQNPRMVARAKAEPKMREKLYSIMEQMAKVVPQVQDHLQKSLSKMPAPEAPPAHPQQDATAEEAVKKQLDDAETEMRGVAAQLSKVLVKKAEELFGIGSEMADSIDENIFAIFNNRKVNPQLNRNRDFYQDALHLDHSPTKIDLAEFLDTKQKKAIYLCYRSFVMAVRALGVVQNAKMRPELVLKSTKLQELVVKAQQILMKRKDVIVRYLQALKKPAKEEKDKERGIPKGTFSDFFEKPGDTSP